MKNIFKTSSFGSGVYVHVIFVMNCRRSSGTVTKDLVCPFVFVRI